MVGIQQLYFDFGHRHHLTVSGQNLLIKIIKQLIF